jgi:aryl-alcohol dehydrogenase-like predicted oxidoreductase
METRRLGRVGHESTVLIYGGAALGEVDSSQTADASIEAALAAGINHFDTAAAYGDSELHLGRWMADIRDRMFLATKTGDRTAQGAYDSIRRSLERLRTDRVDLIQLHAVGSGAELDEVTRSGAAVEGAVRAREEGLVGAIGITGHGMGAPAIHTEALRRFPFDTVLTPWNWCLSQFAAYRRDFEALAEACRAGDAGLMVIKAVARNLWRKGEEDHGTTWYEPLEDPRQIDAAVAFALSRSDVVAICTPGDVRLLPLVVEAERRRAEWTTDDIDQVLSGVTEYEPPFLHVEGRSMPDWMEHLVPN